MTQKTRRNGSTTTVHARTSRSVQKSFRIDADVFEAVTSLADREKTSVNGVVNRALRRYIEWEVFAEKFGLQSVPSSTISELFNLLTEKQTRELGENYGNVLAPELITFWFKKFDFATVLKALNILGMRYARLFDFNQVFDGKTYTLFIRHGKGLRLSIYYEEAAKALFGKLGIKPEISLTESQVTVIIPAQEARPFRTS